MADVLVLLPRVTVPPDAVEIRSVRSSGPGGQNVNKVASKVQLRVQVHQISGLDAAALARLRTLAAGALDREGWILVTSQRTRDRSANLEDAISKIRALVRRALHVPRVRRKTAPTRSSVERRIDDKKRHAKLKASRREADG